MGTSVTSRPASELRRMEWARPSCRRSLGPRRPLAEAEVPGEGAPRLEPVGDLQTNVTLCNHPINSVRFTLNQYTTPRRSEGGRYAR